VSQSNLDPGHGTVVNRFALGWITHEPTLTGRTREGSGGQTVGVGE